MSFDSENMSIMHWTSSEKHKCGYCNSGDSISHGLWAECLTVEDYQDMIDRGWRRSGKYCYKPIMNETCCPQYTIRCDALGFKASKSQKKVVKKMNKFLREGNMSPSGNDVGSSYGGSTGDARIQSFMVPNNVKEVRNKIQFSEVKVKNIENITSKASKEATLMNDSAGSCTVVKEVKKGLGPDTSRPHCKKAKFLRMQRREAKKQENHNAMSVETISMNIAGNSRIVKKANCEKSIRDLLDEPSEQDKHKLQVKLIGLQGAEWEEFKNIEFNLYKKYQMCIHKDPESKCSQSSFERFLVHSPLQSVDNPTYGSFHQQYWLDTKLIAVGVIDILPKCVSSVYFFYDPSYQDFILGTYSALREVEFTQRLHEQHPMIKYYYMGYYIHTCQKMIYKSKFKPSDLLCPETYTWVPIEQCQPKLDASKYSRLQEDIKILDVDACLPGRELDEMKIISNYTVGRLRQYKHRQRQAQIFQTLGLLLGKKLVEKVFVAI